ncbi:hypothetical protein Goarm_011854, partial [Gossypium armourianum]|nr:hypothetical protein [Gossypium armourianum]
MLFVSFLLAASREFLVGRKLEVEDPSEVLQIMQMQAIASSDDIREALKDEHLQKLISDIDSSPDALNVSDELDKAMGLDVFRIFSDKVSYHLQQVQSYSSTLTISSFLLRLSDFIRNQSMTTYHKASEVLSPNTLMPIYIYVQGLLLSEPGRLSMF